MNTVKKYRREIKRMFFMSVKKDLEKWSGNEDFLSPEYNGTKLKLSRESEMAQLRLLSSKSYTDINICTYRFLFIPINIKVWWYARKINIHYKKLQRDKENEVEIVKLKNSLNDIDSFFLKEIRREKLKKLQ